MPTNDTSGPLFTASSPSARLQSSLENRLRARLDANGSPEYALIWKHWDMLSGLPICALRASARRTSGRGSTGWPTVSAGDAKGRKYQYDQHDKTKPRLSLEGLCTGWPTPKAEEDGRTLEQYEAGRMRGFEARRGKTSGGPSSKQGTLAIAVQLTGWPTPNTPSGGPNSKRKERGAGGADLEEVANMAGWATPTARDHKDGASTLDNTPINSLLGRQVSLSPAPMENSDASPQTKRASLNPRFSLWLQGYPIAWAHCAEAVTRSARRSLRSSSAPTSNDCEAT